MQVELKEIEYCKVTLNCEATREEIKNKRTEVLEAFKSAPVPGNRPGHASLGAIKIHYHKEIEEALKRAMAEFAYHEAIFAKQLRPHGSPQFTSLMLTGNKFSCEFNLHTKPNFELAPYKEMEVPKPHQTTNTAELAEKMMQEVRVRFGDVVPYSESDFVQTGDNIIINCQGSVNGESVPNLTLTGEMLTIGNSQLNGFDDNLLGMNVGETREFDLLIPETGLPSIAGKTVHFKVELTTGSKTTPCALDDELATRVGKKDFNELKAYITEVAMGQVVNNDRSSLNEAVANRLVNDNKFEVPNFLSLSEAQYLVHSSKLNWETLVDVDKERYLQMGERNVKLALILDKVREVEVEAQLSDQEVFEIIKNTVANTQGKVSVDDIMKEMARSGYLQVLFSRIRDEYALDFIVKNIKLIE